MTYINTHFIPLNFQIKTNGCPLLHRSSTITAVANPLNGLEIGIPLNIFSNIYTNLHYGYDVTTIKSVLIQFLFDLNIAPL